MTHPLNFDRRQLLLGFGAAGLVGFCDRGSRLAAQISSRLQVSIADFGAAAGSAADSTAAIQAAIRFVERNGGGTVLIPGRYRCGDIVISGKGVRLQGQSGWLVDGRLSIGSQATNVAVADLGILHTRRDSRAYLLDVSGQGCTFDNVRLVKDPIAGGVQMYLRQTSSGCTFRGLRLKGSNGIILAGRDHLFENFELESTMSKSVGGDDAFAIKAVDAVTENITIRDGVVRGYGAIVSFGSEIGTSKDGTGRGIVRNVTVENVTGDRCTRIAFFKPGALIYDFRNGLVEHVVLSNVTLTDPSGEYFRTGIYMLAGRGATIRDIRANGIRISARAVDRGVATTSAIQIYAMDQDAPATIEDVRLQVEFTDPYSGAPHSPAARGYPIDYIAQIEKQNPAKGSISGISLDLDGRGASFGGILVGSGLDGAVSLTRAHLSRVVSDPKATAGAAGIWSESRILLGDVSIDAVKGPKFGGRAFSNRRP
jgi:hypothetical protein